MGLFCCTANARSRQAAGLRRWLPVCLLAVPALALSGTVSRLDVMHEGNLYRLVMEARVEAPDGKVRAILLDYEHLARLNPSIKEVALLSTGNDRLHRVRSVVQACFLFFCKKVTQVQDVEELSDGGIIATTLPEQSDFRYGEMRWRIVGEGQGVRLHFTADFSPAFWVPPLIGPLVIEHKLRKEALKTIVALETLAAKSKRP